MTTIAGEPLRIPEAERARNLVALIRGAVDQWPDREAVRWRSPAGWRSWTYAELWDQVAAAALGLRDRGVGAGDRVVILSRSRPEWIVADLAVMSLGAVTCPLYPGDPAGRMAEITRRAGTRLVIVEDGRLLARLASASPEPALGYVLFEDGGRTPAASTLQEVIAGAHPTPARLAEWSAIWRTINPAQVATIVHTIGVDGEPLGVVVAHGNLLHSIYATLQLIPLSENDVVLSVLPMSHMFERGVGILAPLARGVTIVFADRQIERWAADIAEIRPTLMASIPLFFERLEQRIRLDVARRPAPVRALFGWGLRLGDTAYLNRVAGRANGPWFGLRHRLADELLMAPLRRALGGRLRFFVSGGAALPEATGRFFDAIGIPVIEGYGLTESAPVLTGNSVASYRYGTVGPPVAGTEVRIDQLTGEIQARGPQIMLGYLDRPAETARALDGEGWLRTGDVGVFDEAGHLRITGRLKNLLVLATGKNVAPAPIEGALRTSPFIAQAVALGDDRDAVGVLIVPELDAIRKRLGWTDRTQPDSTVIADPRVSTLLRGEIDRVTGEFAAFERPRRFVLLPRRLAPSSGEVDAHGKPDRAAVTAAFPDEVADLFDRQANHRPAHGDVAPEVTAVGDAAPGSTASAPG